MVRSGHYPLTQSLLHFDLLDWFVILFVVLADQITASVVDKIRSPLQKCIQNVNMQETCVGKNSDNNIDIKQFQSNTYMAVECNVVAGT